MTGWLARFFNRSSGGEVEGYVAVKDESGRTVYRPERRAQKRRPFSGRPEMLQEDFNRLSEFTSEVLGIRLDTSDLKFLEGRLMNRLRSLHIGSFREYSGYLLSRRGINNELDEFINAITTGKTHFWRESDHFEFILHTGADKLLSTRDSIRAWSLGCSTGEEPYTLAMILSEHASRGKPYEFSVLGTDISELALKKAAAAEYAQDSVINLPAHFLETYTTSTNGTYIIDRRIRGKVTFNKTNLLDDDYCLKEPIDIAFFRNVGFYFSPGARENILKRVCENLSPDGYLFLGHSESIAGFNLPLKHLQGTIYRKTPG